MKKIYKGIVLLTLLIICSGGLKAQPYIYTHPHDTIYVHGNPCYPIYQINILNGQKKLIDNYSDECLLDNTNTWLFEIIDDPTPRDVNVLIKKLGTKEYHGGSSVYPEIAIYSRLKNKLYVYGEGFYANRSDAFLSVVNTIKNEEEFSLKANYIIEDEMFLSANEDILYFTSHDTDYKPIRENKIKILSFSTSSYKIIQTKNLQDLGYPGANEYSILEGRKGKGIIRSLINRKTQESYYSIYDFDHKSSSKFIFCQGDYFPMFTNDGKYLMLAQYKDSVLHSGIKGYRTGLFLIYNVPGQSLIKTLQLPSKRSVLTFDEYPENIYYFNNKTDRAITLKIDSLVNTPSGATDSPKVIMYNLGNTVFTADFINGKIKYELGKGFTIMKRDTTVVDKLNYNEYDENNNLLGVFSFDKGYSEGTYTNDKNKKVFQFSRIDKEP